MKYLIVFLSIYFYSATLTAQVVEPVISIDDDALTHNMHICADGEYYYTVNGGVSSKGIINRFDNEGRWKGSFPLKLDMRSLMYNTSDKTFYVSEFGTDIHKITDIQIGAYEIALRGLYTEPQACPSISPDGKQIFVLEDNTVKIIDFINGQTLATFTNIKSGSSPGSGSCAIAAGTKYFYTWNADNKMVYAYDMEGKLKKEISISKGNYGFSLSFANGLVFVSQDGDGSEGTWYGYDLDAVAEATISNPSFSFVSNVQGIPYHICYNADEKAYYTAHCKDDKGGIITEFSSSWKQKKSTEIDKTLRSVLYSPLNKSLYITTATKNFFKVINLKKGEVNLVAGNLFPNRECTPSFTLNGINIYCVANTKMIRYDFYVPKNKSYFSGIRSGMDADAGAYACAVGKKFIYTWDAHSRLVYVYNFEGKYLHSVQLSKGSYGTSLSFANGYLFVAGEGEAGELIWYAYELE